MIDGLKAANAGPLPTRQRRADLARDHVGLPRARDADARRLPRPGRHLQRGGRARLLRLVDRPRALRQHRRGVPRHQRRRRRLRRRAGRELDRRRGRALARPVPDDAAVHRRRDQPLRAPQPAAQARLARRHRRRLRPSAGAGAMPRLAQPPPARTPSAGRSRATPKARAWPASTRRWPASPASARRANTACTSSRRRSRTTRTTAPASRSSPIPAAHPQPKASGHDCTSLVVSVANRPGAVHDMLVPLKAHGVSMTRFESRPARSGQWEYYFYIDLARPPRPAARRRGAATSCARPARSSSCSAPIPIDAH